MQLEPPRRLEHRSWWYVSMPFVREATLLPVDLGGRGFEPCFKLPYGDELHAPVTHDFDVGEDVFPQVVGADSEAFCCLLDAECEPWCR